AVNLSAGQASTGNDFFAQRQADLQITKDDGATAVIAGTSTTYTITLKNNGSAAVPAGVVIHDSIPANTTGSTIDSRCSISGGVLSCTTTAALANGASTSFQLTLAVASGYPTNSLANTASIFSSPVADPTPGNNSSTDTDTVNTSADLSITKSDSADPVDPGQAFDYTLTVHNAGQSDASGINVTDTVPSQFTVNSVSA